MMFCNENFGNVNKRLNDFSLKKLRYEQKKQRCDSFCRIAEGSNNSRERQRLQQFIIGPIQPMRVNDKILRRDCRKQGHKRKTVENSRFMIFANNY